MKAKESLVDTHSIDPHRILGGSSHNKLSVGTGLSSSHPIERRALALFEKDARIEHPARIERRLQALQRLGEELRLALARTKVDGLARPRDGG